MLESIPVAVLVHDHGTIVRCNALAARLMAATPESPLVGRSVRDFVTERSREIVRERTRANFTHGLCPDCLSKYHPNRPPG
jgi:PAS domain-containing protein